MNPKLLKAGCLALAATALLAIHIVPNAFAGRNRTTGIYSCPPSSVCPAVTKTPISSVDFDALISDLISAINSIPSNIVTFTQSPFNFNFSTSNSDPLTQGALVLYRPELDSTTHLNGIYIHPKYPFIASDSSSFMASYNCAWMQDDSSNIPSGYKTNLSCFEGNISTAQAASDASDGPHIWGGTLQGFGGVRLQGGALAMTIGTVAADANGWNVDITNNVAGGTQYAYRAGSGGPHAIYSGFAAFGNITYPFLFNDFQVHWDGTYTTISADGFQTRSGLSGPATGNYANIAWGGAHASLYIDNSNIGQIWTVPGGTTGVTISGTSCTITAIVNGIITAGHCP